MLLYVDKKKQKRQKIKKISFGIGVALFLALNFLHFPTALHTSQKSLYTYPAQPYSTNWYHNASPITIFAPEKSSSAKIILLPPTLNRENLTTFIYALVLAAPQAADIRLTRELADNNIIAQTLQTVISRPQAAQASSSPLVITSDFNTICQKIIDEKLFPKTLSYEKAQAISDSPKVSALLNRFYPLPEPPHSKQEKELAALKNFADNYQPALKKYIAAANKHRSLHPAFADMDILLQNAPLCIKTAESQACALNTEFSLLQNIKDVLHKLPANSVPQSLILLTSAEPVSTSIPLKKDEGLLFKFEQRQELLLPHELFNSANSPGIGNYQKFFAALKQKAGVNPDYSNNKMEFYKFKTMEIKL